MNEKFCQCCGMPMNDTNDLYGLNADGIKNDEYCSYCFKDGTFTFEGTMEEMVEICLPNVLLANSEMTEKDARAMMLAWFPTLKRWQK